MVTQHVVIFADLLSPVSDSKARLMRDAVMVIRPTTRGWRIAHIGPREKYLRQRRKEQVLKTLDLSGLLLMPGFFDMHFHWVQDEVRLMPKDSLLTWLQKYTWPYEMKFKSKRFSRREAKSFAAELARMGTLGGGCYGSIHSHTVDHALEEFKGDFVVGNVLMTMNSPKGLRQTKKGALSIVKTLSERYKNRYALTPRFAPTTHPDVMSLAAKSAKKNKSFMQSHLSETKEEIEYVLGMYQKLPGFADVKTYTEIYEKCGLLGPRTIMGHGIYLADQEWQTLKQSGTAIAHCPTSNASVKRQGLGSGLFDFSKAEKYAVPWALGSDIGGGPFLSMFDVMNSFVELNRQNKKATYTKALYRASLAGAKILGIDKENGSLEEGKWANFIAVPSPKQKVEEDAESLLKSLLRPYLKNRKASQDLVVQTYYKGECLYEKNDDQDS